MVKMQYESVPIQILNAKRTIGLLSGFKSIANQPNHQTQGLEIRILQDVTYETKKLQHNFS